MALINVPKPVPRPPQSALDLDRPVSTLLKTQISHFYEAEMKLPLQYRTAIYVNAIRTESEAASYIRAVTEAIHRAHSDAEAKRRRRAIKPKRLLEIAAAASPMTSRGRNKKKAKSARRR